MVRRVAWVDMIDILPPVGCEIKVFHSYHCQDLIASLCYEDLFILLEILLGVISPADKQDAN